MYDVKFGFATGYNLVFAAFQPSGIGRGMANQPLYEVFPAGYYRCEPATQFVEGDMVLVYDLETITWEDAIVVYLDYDYVFYEGKQVYWEGDWVRDLDNSYNDVVYWTGDVVGSGEFTFRSGEVSSLVDDVDTLLEWRGTVNNSYDERTVGAEGQALMSTGVLTVEGGDC